MDFTLCIKVTGEIRDDSILHQPAHELKLGVETISPAPIYLKLSCNQVGSQLRVIIRTNAIFELTVTQRESMKMQAEWNCIYHTDRMPKVKGHCSTFEQLPSMMHVHCEKCNLASLIIILYCIRKPSLRSTLLFTTLQRSNHNYSSQMGWALSYTL